MSMSAPWGRRQILGTSLLAVAMFQRTAWAAPTVQRDSRPLMGTRLDITVEHVDPGVRQAALSAAWAHMARLTHLMSRYEADSLVSALHARAGRTPLSIPPEMMSVLRTAQRMSERSAGAFDITVGAFAQWDFSPARPHMPTVAELARERPLVDYRDLVLDPRRMTAYLRRPGMRLDLGGIAKLPILAAGMAALQGHGVRHAMINGGGDVLVAGQLQGRDWRVGLRDAHAPDRLLGVIDIRDGFVASSGDYERCFERNGQRYHHILNPRTGQPSRGPRGVALVSRDLEAINGLGAAIMVAGRAWGQSTLAELGPHVESVIFDHDRSVWPSAGLARQLKPA